MFVSGRRGAVITTLLQDMPALMPAAARQPPHRTLIELSATIDFMLATLVGNGAAWSVSTLPAIKVNSHPVWRLVKVRCWRAPCKDGAFQWVQVPPGNRSSRKQSEQSWR